MTGARCGPADDGARRHVAGPRPDAVPVRRRMGRCTLQDDGRGGRAAHGAGPGDVQAGGRLGVGERHDRTRLDAQLLAGRHGDVSVAAAHVGVPATVQTCPPTSPPSIIVAAFAATGHTNNPIQTPLRRQGRTSLQTSVPESACGRRPGSQIRSRRACALRLMVVRQVEPFLDVHGLRERGLQLDESPPRRSRSLSRAHCSGLDAAIRASSSACRAGVRDDAVTVSSSRAWS